MIDQGRLDFERDHADPKLAAEQALASAESLVRSGDPRAEGALEHAETSAIACADQQVQMLTFESSGRFHETRGEIRLAREKYRTALRSAECLSVVSDEAVEHTARLRWDLVRIENRKDSAFKNLLRASKRDDSPDRLRNAWEVFVAERQTAGGRLAARGFGSVEDFRRRIDAAELDPDDDE